MYARKAIFCKRAPPRKAIFCKRASPRKQIFCKRAPPRKAIEQIQHNLGLGQFGLTALQCLSVKHLTIHNNNSRRYEYY